MARRRTGAVLGSQQPVGVLAGEVGVEVDHLRLEPEAELHPQRMHPVDQPLQATWPDGLVDVPVPQAGPVVAPAEEPPVVEHEALDAHLRGALGQGDQLVGIVGEVDGLPHVEQNGSRPGRMRRAGAQGLVEPIGQVVEALPPGAQEPGSGVVPSGIQSDLAGQEQLTTAQQPPAGRRVLGGDHLVAAVREVDAPHPTLTEPEPGLPRAQQRRRVMPGPPAPGLAHPVALVERPPLRGALAAVPAGHVQQLTGLSRDREGRLQLAHLVGLGAEVAHRGTQPDQATGQHLQLDDHLKGTGGIGADGHDPHSSPRTIGPARIAGLMDLVGHRVECNRPGASSPASQEPRPAQPSRRVLGKHRDGLQRGQRAVEVGHRQGDQDLVQLRG